MRGADRCRRAVLLKTASERVWGSIRSPIVVDRSKTLLGLGVWAGSATKYIFAQGCCLGAIQRISAPRSQILRRALLVPIPIGLNLTRFPTVWQEFKPLPDCGFDRLVDINKTAPTYKESPIGLVNKKLK